MISAKVLPLNGILAYVPTEAGPDPCSTPASYAHATDLRADVLASVKNHVRKTDVWAKTLMTTCIASYPCRGYNFLHMLCAGECAGQHWDASAEPGDRVP